MSKEQQLMPQFPDNIKELMKKIQTNKTTKLKPQYDPFYIHYTRRIKIFLTTCHFYYPQISRNWQSNIAIVKPLQAV